MELIKVYMLCNLCFVDSFNIIRTLEHGKIYALPKNLALKLVYTECASIYQRYEGGLIK